MADTHISTIIREYVTVAGIVIAGGWALWRWGYEEWLRRYRDFPALDGDLSVKDTNLPNDKAAIVVNALWRNKGKLPVELDTAKTFVEVYRIDSGIDNGPLELNSRGMDLVYRVNMLAGSSAYILEPGTESIMQQCFVVSSTDAFLFHWAICIAGSQAAYPYQKGEMWCTRYLIWKVETKKV